MHKLPTFHKDADSKLDMVSMLAFSVLLASFSVREQLVEKSDKLARALLQLATEGRAVLP